jgi:hypothetical protein
MILAVAEMVFARPKIVFPAQGMLRSSGKTAICRGNAVLAAFRRVAAATGGTRGGEGGAAAGARRPAVGDQTRHLGGGRDLWVPRPGFRVAARSEAVLSRIRQHQERPPAPQRAGKIPSAVVS